MVNIGESFVARAHRHYIPGHIWHITHRCHKREFLLKFAKDRHRWLQWLFEVKKRYGLIILNYTVTSNHIHLIVYDDSDQDVIPKSIQLLSSRTGQEYNQRKKRKGAFWEDRYHATIIEDGEHLLRCIVYNDMNMVRAGVVEHPGKWMYGGYNEIQTPRRKCVLIDYEVLMRLAGFNDYSRFQIEHGKWVSVAISEMNLHRESQWTQAIAIGSESFLDAIKKKMRSLAIGRSIKQSENCCELREAALSYNCDFDAKKSDIESDNTYFWDKSILKSE